MIERTFDEALVRGIVTRRDIWATTAEDDQNPENWQPDMSEGWFIARDEENRVIGLYNLHVRNSVTLEIHPMILTEHRGSKAYRSGKEMLQWIVDNTDYQKVVCTIPVIYKNVKQFAVECGMEQEGTVTNSYRKNGNIIDQWMLGITRSQIEALRNE